MATLDQQLYSQNHWIAIDGVQTIWNFTFAGGYIFPEHVKAYYVDENNARVAVDLELTGEFQATVDPPVPATASRFVIYRQTPKDVPLVDFNDGSNVTEPNLDRIARQAIFVAAEAADAVIVEVETALGSQLDLSPYGFRRLAKVAYTGASEVAEADNGKAHFKTDGTDVTVPSDLSDEHLCSIANYSATPMTVTFEGTARLQGADDPSAHATWTLAPWNTLTIWKVAAGAWLVSGKAEAV